MLYSVKKQKYIKLKICRDEHLSSLTSNEDRNDTISNDELANYYAEESDW